MPREREELIESVKDRGFTPSVRDVPDLIDLAASVDRELGRQAVQSLLRVGPPALAEAHARFAASGPPLRARLCELIARANGGEAVPWLIERLQDRDGATRRRAAAALGKAAARWPARQPEIEAALVRALRGSNDAADRRAFTEALGRAAGEEGLDVLAQERPQDELHDQRLATARVRIKQRSLRQSASTIELHASLPESTPLLLHVRAGLETLLIEELVDFAPPEASVREVGRGRVRLQWRQALGPLFRARTFLHLGFPLAPVPGASAVEAVVQGLTSPSTTALLRALTRGPVRYRLHWSAGGARRAHNQQVALEVERVCPWLVNDATQAPWEVVVTEVEGPQGVRVFAELWPRRLEDPRFAYRQTTMPASSHPTVAAALVRVAGVRPNDVVWDPFVGTGMELAERGLAGAFAALWGTDVDAAAVEAARKNLAAAGLPATVLLQDARAFRPPGEVDLLITNPPFGQRVPIEGGVEPLLEAVLKRGVSLLSRRGRVALVTPRVRVTERVLSQGGLRRLRQLPIDVGGFDAHLELWQR